MRVAWWLQVAGVSAGLSGCSSHDWYVVSPLQRAAQLAAAEAHGTAPAAAAPTAGTSRAPQDSAWVLAERRSDGQRVWLRTSAVDWSGAATLPGHRDGLLVRARAYNPALTAGSTLTWVGTAVSLLGSGLFLAGRVRGDEALFLAGSLTALTAEPVMWAGIAYWLAGTMRPPQESRVAPTASAP